MKQLLALLPAIALSACLAPPPPPPITPNPPGTAYRAVGTEPFWGLSIDERQMVFTAPDSQPVSQPTPKVIIGFAGEIYQTPRLNVNIVHLKCSDGMSDRTYPDKVQVTVDGRRFEGCGGGAVEPASLAATNWGIVSVNGRAIPPGGEYFLRFDQTRASAKFGCNAMGGAYTQTGGTLSVGPVMATRMACPDMRFENQAGAVFNLPMTMSWNGGDSLTLSNAAGRIELARSY